MAQGDVVVRFDKVSFEYSATKPILDEVDFSIRRGSKITLMGQNGAGKSTIFSLLTKQNIPESGRMTIVAGTSIAIAKQVIPRERMDWTVREFFQACFEKKIYDIDPRITAVLEVVNLTGHFSGSDIFEKKISSFSGGQQARLLLASALIQQPDILLLDEPTNNLDTAGIQHLTDFLIEYKKTVIVISHDAEFLNAFTHGVLYLDVFTRKIEQYVGNYTDVVRDISVRIERENMKNAQLVKEIQAKKEKANQFAFKGGQMRLVAKRMREKAEELEEDIVDVRKEDRTIKSFVIPVQGDVGGDIAVITGFSVLKNGKPTMRKAAITLKKNMHLQLRGPNGIGKTTLLEAIMHKTAEGVTIAPGVRIGYYRQDFSTLDFNDTVAQALRKAMEASGARFNEERMRAVAASFLITTEYMRVTVGALSEGQKAMVAFASLVLLEPALLILDEPTNHVNFRHLPIIAKALGAYGGAMIIVSHVKEFVSQIRIDEVLDLDK